MSVYIYIYIELWHTGAKEREKENIIGMALALGSKHIRRIYIHATVAVRLAVAVCLLDFRGIPGSFIPAASPYIHSISSTLSRARALRGESKRSLSLSFPISLSD